ncbi:hypothetical protein EYF80_033127 [Liparis tanakae]|uniref:Uncharacterized protein n=1 Tax=Liparis tanakae TaxID=230148 RepID=A0A4Z2GTQ2_9TELE|nr:hypothetical protein EYF80_033127 [Liparis tanakae]
MRSERRQDYSKHCSVSHQSLRKEEEEEKEEKEEGQRGRSDSELGRTEPDDDFMDEEFPAGETQLQLVTSQQQQQQQAKREEEEQEEEEEEEEDEEEEEEEQVQAARLQTDITVPDDSLANNGSVPSECHS